MENRRHLQIDIFQDDYAFIDQLRRIAAARNGANPSPQSSFSKGLAKLEEQHGKKPKVSKLDIIGKWTLQAATAETCGICYYQNWDHCISCQAEAASTSPELICLCDNTSGVCGHVFHTHCITRSIGIRNACPNCDLEGAFFGLQWRDVGEDLPSIPLRPKVPFPVYTAQPLHQLGLTSNTSQNRHLSRLVSSSARNNAWPDKPVQAKSPSWPWAEASNLANTAPYPQKSIPLDLPIRSRPLGQKPINKNGLKPMKEGDQKSAVENDEMKERKKKEHESEGKVEGKEEQKHLKAEEQKYVKAEKEKEKQNTVKEEKEKRKQKAAIDNGPEPW